MNTRVSYNNYAGRGYGYCNGSVENVVFKTLSEIEEILNYLNELIEVEGYVSVAEYYKKVNVSVMKDDYMVGWTDELLNVNILRTRCGYSLNMPIAKCLNTDPVKKAMDDVINILRAVNSDDSIEHIDDAIDNAINLLQTEVNK